MIDLLIWLGVLIVTLTTFSLLTSIIKSFNPNPSIWLLLFSFLMNFLLLRIGLGYLAEQLLKKIPPEAHEKQINRIGGAAPGLFNGVFYVLLFSLLVSAFPISDSIYRETTQSKLLPAFTSRLEGLQTKLLTALEDVNRSINTLTVKPGSEKFIKLPYKVTNPTRRPDLELEMFEMVNKERRKEGLLDLKADIELTKVALLHSKDMFARGYFSHLSPEGKTPFDRIRKENVSFLTAGENLALAQTLRLAHTGLMNSPGHRANILHKSFGRIGIGILDGGVYGIMVTQNFRN
jgi:uncharacterized protein YkwD